MDNSDWGAASIYQEGGPRPLQFALRFEFRSERIGHFHRYRPRGFIARCHGADMGDCLSNFSPWGRSQRNLQFGGYAIRDIRR